ncbi:MerR family transcriptional regulator [Candidatus Aerophobetes bacterium]|nr:MerR family transcriptional regulator [Candidatus Aerophobetes bacterium]
MPEKIFFSIGEVSEITGLPSYVLRFWENKFSSLHPQKSRGGHRRYQKRDIEQILLIKNLLYENGFTIQGAQRELKKKKNDFNIGWLKEQLKEILKTLE